MLTRTLENGSTVQFWSLFILWWFLGVVRSDGCSENTPLEGCVLVEKSVCTFANVLLEFLSLRGICALASQAGTPWKEAYSASSENNKLVYDEKRQSSSLHDARKRANQEDRAARSHEGVSTSCQSYDLCVVIRRVNEGVCIPRYSHYACSDLLRCSSHASEPPCSH